MVVVVVIKKASEYLDKSRTNAQRIPAINNNVSSLRCEIKQTVIPGLTRGRAKMQRTVTPRLTWSTDSETDGHGGVITIALRSGESVLN